MTDSSSSSSTSSSKICTFFLELLGLSLICDLADFKAPSASPPSPLVCAWTYSRYFLSMILLELDGILCANSISDWSTFLPSTRMCSMCSSESIEQGKTLFTSILSEVSRCLKYFEVSSFSRVTCSAIGAHWRDRDNLHVFFVALLRFPTTIQNRLGLFASLW